MCWCPITSLDYASEAYEWNLGVTRTDLSEDMQALSDAMAEQFALYINELGLTDEDGNVLTLVASEEGIYQAGSYYDYLKTVIETSLNNFLEDTTFPYTVESNGKGGLGNLGDFDGELPDLADGETIDGTFGGRGGKGDLDIGADGLDGEITGGRGGRGFDGELDGDLPDMKEGLTDLDGEAHAKAGVEISHCSVVDSLHAIELNRDNIPDALNLSKRQCGKPSESKTI